MCNFKTRINTQFKMENMSNKENLYFDPTTGKLCTSRSASDKAIAVDMNKQGSGGFFVFHLEGEGDKERIDNNVLGTVSFPLQCTVLNC